MRLIQVTTANSPICGPTSPTFWGYPPVLMVVANRLAVSNPSTEARDIWTEDLGHRGEILQIVVETIMQREADKVRKHVAPALGWDADDPRVGSLYQIEEQALRITAYLIRETPPALSPITVPDADRAAYEDQIATFVPDHPFLRERKPANVVFSDYLRAYIVHSAMPDVHGIDIHRVRNAFSDIGTVLLSLSLYPKQGGAPHFQGRH